MDEIEKGPKDEEAIYSLRRGRESAGQSSKRDEGRLRDRIEEQLLVHGPVHSPDSGRGAKRSNFITGVVLLVLGLFICTRGCGRGATIDNLIAALRNGQQPPPGGGEMLLGILVALVGVIFFIVRAVKKEKRTTSLSNTS